MYLLVRVAVACVLYAHITASFDERYAQPHAYALR